MSSFTMWWTGAGGTATLGSAIVCSSAGSPATDNDALSFSSLPADGICGGGAALVVTAAATDVVPTTTAVVPSAAGGGGI